MKKILLSLLILFSGLPAAFSQTISEKEMFSLKFKGKADTYSFLYDSISGNYCYIYRIEDDNKAFIISKNSTSEKYDEIWRGDIRFDSKGNYYAVAANFKADYGLDNNFLIVNGKEVLNFPVIDSYDSYINKSGEFVFVFKQFDRYKIGYYSIGKGLRQSEAYDAVKPVFQYKELPEDAEEDSGIYDEENFYHNEKGERGFIAISNDRAKIIFDSEVIETDFSDINEVSFTKNKNNELCYIAKSNGRFYEKAGDEFVVSGKSRFDKFPLVTYPLMFDAVNEPVYVAGDSVSEFGFNYYPVIGNDVQAVYLDYGKKEKAPDFRYGINLIDISGNGDVTYTGMAEIVIPAVKQNPEDEAYDTYYSRTFFVKNGVAREMGYNIGPIKYNENGDMLYSGIADLDKKEYLLMMNYGESKIIINKDRYDEIMGYGFTPGNEIYYVGVKYENPETGNKSESSVYIADKLIGKFEYVTFQYSGDTSSVLKFGTNGKFAIAGEEQTDTATYSSYIVTDEGRLPFPKDNASGSDRFSYISSMMFLRDNKLFFVGDMGQSDPEKDEVKKEIFVNNKSTGKVYNSIDGLKYDEYKNEVTFTGTRGKKIYFVTVKL